MLPVMSLILFIGVAQSAAAQAARTWDHDQQKIADLIERVEAANNAGDVEGWVSFFSDDAVYMPPGVPPVTTRAGLIEIAQAGFRHRASIDIEPVEIQVFGTWAFARSRVTGTVKLAGSGETVLVDVKQLVIYRRNDAGNWQIARLINNSNSQ
jgi:uncharacterized protein (TIGR02246 family)